MRRSDRTYRTGGKQGGFSLIESIVAVAIFAISLSGVTVAAAGLRHAASLDGAALTLLTEMRLAQSLGTTSAQAGILWLDPYDTRYQVTHGTTSILQNQYPPDVNYVDGYLQLANRRLSYDDLGDAQVAGTIRLTNGLWERDVKVYMGTGLQVAGWLAS